MQICEIHSLETVNSAWDQQSQAECFGKATLTVVGG